MKKTSSILTVAALALMAATPALAHGDKDDSNKGGELKGKARAEVRVKSENALKNLLKVRLSEDKFVMNGTVTAVTAESISLNVVSGAHVDSWIGKVAVVAIDSDTDIRVKGNKDAVAADVKVGDKVVIKGELEEATFEADHIMVVNSNKAVGTVTAKTDSTLTIKNTVTGIEKTVTLDPETEVKINGETSTAADIQVGDSGWVKFKTKVDVTVAKIINLFR